MPKRKDPATEDEASIDLLALSHKKHKKHKHKKHKKKRGEDGDDASGGGSPGTPSDGFKHGLKLKIKIGGQTFGEASCRVAKSEINEGVNDESANIDVVEAPPAVASLLDPLLNPGSSKKGKKVDDDDAWLEALEEGRLEEVDEELRRMKDPNLMTARQRSLLESKAQKEKEETLPVVTETKVLSEEMIQQRMIQAKKRKKLAEEKKEKDKKQTIERLLKKPDTKPKSKKVIKKADVPKVKYIDNEFKGRALSFPVGFSYPIKAQIAKDPPPPVFCGVKGCENRKKYSCSKTGVPLCSLVCYKKNMVLAANSSSVIPVS